MYRVYKWVDGEKPPARVQYYYAASSLTSAKDQTSDAAGAHWVITGPPAGQTVAASSDHAAEQWRIRAR